MTIVWIYVDTNKEVGDRDHLKVFATPELAKENDQEGIMFGYEVIEEITPGRDADGVAQTEVNHFGNCPVCGVESPETSITPEKLMRKK